jgi:uncharacterized protein YigE (DUF2233 family)
MKRSLLAILLACSSASLFAADPKGSTFRDEYAKEKNGPHGECRSEWRAMQPGLDYRQITCLGDEDDVDLHVIRVNTDLFTLDTALMHDALAREVARDRHAPFAINANFFDAARNAEGLVMRGGAEVQKPRSSSWQALFVVTADGQPMIVPVAKWSALRRNAFMGVQSGPRLVIGGHTNRVHQSYSAARSGVCISKSKELTFFVTPPDRKLDMYEIAAIARRGEEDGGLRCHDAMLFDGGHSAQFYLADGRGAIILAGDRVPAFIYATPKAQGTK